MRDPFVNGMLELSNDPETIFLTGDLGFGALEPLRATMGDRFINAGIAEQNMVSMAAGLAYSGLSPWCYSIAPFVYARPYEQIRNDVGLHDLSVKLVGNGGGYGYGVMGATHHAIEDYGVMGTVQHMTCYIPAFDPDVRHCLDRMHRSQHPSYLRLGRQEYETWLPDYKPWRQLVAGRSYKPAPVIVAVGPVAGALMENLTKGDGPYVTDCWEPSARQALWVVSELPILDLPPAFIEQVWNNEVIVVEEHIEQGSFGQQLAYALAKRGIPIFNMRHFCARGYTSGRYGSQQFHRAESGIDVEEICRNLREYTRL